MAFPVVNGTLRYLPSAAASMLVAAFQRATPGVDITAVGE
jgi:hypothetical protein